METLLKDIKHSVRIFLRNPTFTIAATVALALGIGANSAIFSVVNAVLLKPLNAPGADRIVRFVSTYPGGSSATASFITYNVWRRQTNVFEDISAHRLDLVNLTGGAYPEQIPAARVTANFFRLFGAPVIQGRVFRDDEDRPDGGHIAVISYGLWKRRFGSDPKAVGRTISLGDAPRVVIGVLGPGFDSEQFDQVPEVWVPFQIEPDSKDGGSFCLVSGRLNRGVNVSMARAALQPVASQYRRAFPRMNPRQGFSIELLRDAMVGGDVRSSLLLLAGAVGFVLLIACANVTNLLLVRATGRQREIAIRAAVGAGRGRMIRQLLTESMVLSAAGGALGLVLGLAGIRLLLAMPVNIPRIGEHGSSVTLDWRVLTFTILVSLITGVLFGLVPALQASRADLTATLTETSGRSGTGSRQNGARSLLVICEISLALVLLVGAALLIRTSLALRAVNPGFDSHDVLTMQMSLSGTRFEGTSSMDQLVRESVRRVHALPGVTAASASCCVPLEVVWQLPFIIAGRPLNGAYHGFAGWTFTSAEYFDAFKIPVVRGRAFTERDNAGAPGVVIINQEMARRSWPNGDPLNDRLLIGRGMRPEYEQDPVRQIVGIVGDVRDTALNRNPRPAMYVPIAQLPDGINTVNLRLLPVAWIVRTRGEPHSLSSAIQNELREASGGLPVARVRTMDEVASQSTARTKFNMLLLTIFGCSALLLAAIGIYGVMAYSIEQRTREIGIRLALGAQVHDVRNLIGLQGLRLTLIGVVAGIALSWGVTRFIASFLFGVKPLDPLVFTIVPVLLSAVALFSIWLPARRATLIDPIDALRHP